LKSFKALIADLWPIVPYIGHWALNGISDVRAILLSLTDQPISDEEKQSLASTSWQLILLLLRYPLQFVLTIVSLLLNALVSYINNVFNLSNERYLTEQEVQYLQPIFCANLDYDVIKIQTGGIKEKLGISPQAVGVDVFLRQVWGSVIVNDDQSLTPAGLRLLGHEACHVWQYQHRGAGYIGDSLITQVLDVLSRKLDVTLSDGYDVLPALYSRLEYKLCNVEQQAVMAELIGVACSVPHAASYSKDGANAHAAHAQLSKHAGHKHQLTCQAFNKATGYALVEDEFALILSAHAQLSGSDQ